MTQVLDYSAGKPGALAIVRAGYHGAVRYIGYPGRGKCTNANEFQDFSRNGVGMALVFENSATWWRRGFAGGQADAATARAHANAIGFPESRPIYYAIDQQVSNADLGLAVDYIRGAASVEGVARVGVYGQYSVVKAVATADAAKYLWQCRAWSGTPIQYFGGRHLFQMVGTVDVGGIGCDINDINASDWGQHNASPLEDDVAFSDEIAVTAPSDRNYVETHKASEIIGDTFFRVADMYNTFMWTVVPAISSLAAASSNGQFDQLTFESHMAAALKKAVDNSVVPIVQQAMRAAGADEFADAVIDELQRRLAQTPTPQQPTA